MTEILYAHSSADGNLRNFETLDGHLQEVASRAAENASKFGAADLGWLIGAYHDLGKAKKEFQYKIVKEPSLKVQHSLEGAQTIIENYHGLGRILAPLITGHHTGLANGRDFPATGSGTPFSVRIREVEGLNSINSILDESHLSPKEEIKKCLSNLITDKKTGSADTFKIQFFMRMLFSCLVDADFIATEKFYQEVDRGCQVSLEELRERLDTHLEGFSNEITEINGIRGRILSSARIRANDNPGFFSMTVPTGGGKTLSSMAFALDHAIKFGMKRIIYVIPFTSIVEQNASVFKEVFQSNEAVLEHHSAFDTYNMDRDEEDSIRRAAENWDRPIIVTTSVQFFESLFSNRTAKCRKLHNISNSVVILDEAQTLPLNLLRPCLAALNALVDGYKTTIVLCTATQPAVLKNIDSNAKLILDEVLPEAGEKTGQTREIAPDPDKLYNEMKRVNVQRIGYLEDGELSESLISHKQVLCIVNNRKHARNLFESIKDAGNAYHLTTNMCASHRRIKLAEIRRVLDRGDNIRVISTSLIEAGVDIDFPVVYRSMAGIDSIAQAAGRCNREGKLRESGQVFVFEPDDCYKNPPEIEDFVSISKSVFSNCEMNDKDVLSLESVRDYYDNLIWKRKAENLDNVKVGDHKGIMNCIRATAGKWNNMFAFADMGNAFRLIRENSIPIVIPSGINESKYGLDMDEIDKLDRYFADPRKFQKLAQQHIVQLPKRILDKMVNHTGDVIHKKATNERTKLEAEFYILSKKGFSLYDDDAGLNWFDIGDSDVGYLMV